MAWGPSAYVHDCALAGAGLHDKAAVQSPRPVQKSLSFKWRNIAPDALLQSGAGLPKTLCCVLQGLVPDKALSRELTQARRDDVRTPGATPLTTPGRTPPGSPRGSAPSTPFRKIPE